MLQVQMQRDKNFKTHHIRKFAYCRTEEKTFFTVELQKWPTVQSMFMTENGSGGSELNENITAKYDVLVHTSQ